MRSLKLTAAIIIAAAVTALIYVNLANTFQSQLPTPLFSLPSEFHIHLIIASAAISAALIAYIYAVLNLIKQPATAQPEAYPPPVPLDSVEDLEPAPTIPEESAALAEGEQIGKVEESVQKQEAPVKAGEKNVKPELDVLLAKIIRDKIEDGSLDVCPQLTLRHSGEYEVLGRKLKGKVKLSLRPKTYEKRREEKVEEGKEEPLF